MGRMMSDEKSGAVNLDANPVIVGSDGEGCRAVDALIYLQQT
jgi:hypothetical protein